MDIVSGAPASGALSKEEEAAATSSGEPIPSAADGKRHRKNAPFAPCSSAEYHSLYRVALAE